MDEVLAGALGQIRSVLPPGSSVSLDPPALAPRSRYWLAFPFPEARKHWLLYPEDARLGRRVLDQIGYRHELAPDPGPAPRIIGVEIPPEAPWRMIGGAKDVAVILWNSSKKYILFCIDRASGEPIGVIKAAQRPATAKGLVRELALLGELHRRGLRLSPRPLGAGWQFEDGSGPAAVAQEFVAGARRAETWAGDFEPIVRWLDQLRLVGRTVSLRALAERLSQRIAAAGDAPADWAPILALLQRVEGAEELPAAVFHGDFRPDNLLVDLSGRMVAIDWEFCDSHGLSGLDFARYVLEEGYRDPRVLSFEALFAARRLEWIERYRAHFFPGPVPSLDRFLALHFCQHYTDRVLAFGRSELGRGLRLQRIAASRWPSGLDGAQSKIVSD